MLRRFSNSCLSFLSLLSLLAAAALGAACGRDSTTGPARGAATSALTIHVTMTGNVFVSRPLQMLVAGRTLAFARSGDTTLDLRPGVDTAYLVRLTSACAVDAKSRIFTIPENDTAHVSFTADCIGGFAYSRAKPEGADIMYVDESGDSTQLTFGEGQRFADSWSPDGKHLLLRRILEDESQSIEVASIDGTPAHPLTTPPAGFDDSYPRYSPDGTRVVFCREPRTVNGSTEVMLIQADGTGEHPVLQPSSGTYDCAPSWSPDGTRFAFMTNRLGEPGTFQVASMRTDGTDVRLLVPDLWEASDTGWSPDGRLIAFNTLLPPNYRQVVGLVSPDGGPMTVPWRGLQSPVDFFWGPNASRIAIALVDNAPPRRETAAIVNTDGSLVATLAPNVADLEVPAWSPDGSRLIFDSNAPVGGVVWLYLCRPDGSDGLPLITSQASATYLPLWNPKARPGVLDGSGGAAVR